MTGVKPAKSNQFKPGESGNPSGRPRTPEDILEARKMNQNTLERLLNHLIYLPKRELKALVENPDTPMIDLMVASIIVQGAQKGDQQRLDFILNRLVGRVTERIEVDGRLTSALPTREEAARILQADYAVMPPSGELVINDIL